LEGKVGQQGGRCHGKCSVIYIGMHNMRESAKPPAGTICRADCNRPRDIQNRTLECHPLKIGFGYN